VYGLGFATALAFGDNDTEVIAALGTGTGKVYGHDNQFNSAGHPVVQIGVSSVALRFERQGRLSACALPRCQSRLLCLRGGLVKARLKIRPVMFPRHGDGGSHIVCQDDELGRSGSSKLRKLTI
jgi:hypothetical protein